MSYGGGGYDRGGYGGYANRMPGRSWSGPAHMYQPPPNLPAGQSNYTDDWFINVANFGNLGAAGTNTASAVQNINVQADSAFELIELTQSANEHGAAEPWSDAIIVPVTLQITDSGSGRQLFSAATPISSLCGTAKQPFILPVPRIFMPKTTIVLSVNNFSANGYDNVFINLIGRKIFDLGPLFQRYGK